MIRCSVKNDIEGIISLWNETFGDSRKEIEFFLDNKFIPDNTVVCEENGEIISQLFLLEGKMYIDGCDYNSYYLYAACTSVKNRGRGIMGQMLEFSKKLAENRGVSFICLMPAEESLFDFYSKFGYKSIFKKKTVKIYFEDLNNIDIAEDNTSDFSFKPVNRIRDERFKDLSYFKWDKPSVEFAFEHIKMYGGNFFMNNKGYCLYTSDDSSISVKETTFTPIDLAAFLKQEMKKGNLSNAEIIIPSNSDFFSCDGKICFNGMILSVKNDDKILKDSINNAYLGLTLD